MKSVVTLAVIIFVLVVVVASLGSLGNLNDAEFARLMRQEGVADAKQTGYAFLACSEDDLQSAGFAGTKNGQHVEGTICGGILFKNYTIRWR
jgi:hypothetical protein